MGKGSFAFYYSVRGRKYLVRSLRPLTSVAACEKHVSLEYGQGVL